MSLTEHWHRRSGIFEFVPGALGEEVTLNLLVQSATLRVFHRSASDTSSREDPRSSAIQHAITRQHKDPLGVAGAYLVRPFKGHPLGIATDGRLTK